MSKLLGSGVTREGCKVTVMDHSSPHDNAPHYEIIMETAYAAEPIEINMEEWDSE